jgi:hypothetical protein
LPIHRLLLAICERGSVGPDLGDLDLQSAMMADLASIGVALGSVKTLFDLAKSAHDTQLAMKITAEVLNIQGKLIDVQQQAIALQSENQTQREEINRLKAKLAETVEFDPCPSCGKKGWHVESSYPDPAFGHLGASHRIYKCSFCAFTENKLFTAM